MAAAVGRGTAAYRSALAGPTRRSADHGVDQDDQAATEETGQGGKEIKDYQRELSAVRALALN